MAKGKITSKVQQGHYQTYKTENRWATNRKKKLQRALKRNPGNAAQIEAAMKNIRYRRGTPKTSMWSHSNKSMAQLFKQFTTAAPHDLFSTNEVTARNALASIKSPSIQPSLVPNVKTMFNISTRAHA